MSDQAVIERVSPAVLRVKDLPKLTGRQSDFVDAILDGGTQSDAYRAAYECDDMLSRTIWANASRLAKHDKVKAWLDWSRFELQEQAKVTLEGHLTDLMRLRDEARAFKQMGPAISAEKLRGEAAGLHNKHATITHMSLDTLPRTVGKLPSQVIEGVIEGGNIDEDTQDNS